MTELGLLNNMEFIKRCYEGITKETLATSSSVKILKPFVEEENLRGNSLIAQMNNNQRTTLLCQEAVKETLKKLGYKNVKNATPFRSSIRDKRYQPDLESDECIWEVKGRNWTTTGTAGEKILGTPLKYCEVPSLYKKPLKIVVVGYQEYEARNEFACGDLIDDNGKRVIELDEILAFYKERNIEYIAFTDLLKELGLPYGCWDK